MFEAADRRTLNDILGQVTELVTTNTALVAGVDQMNVGLGALQELTGKLVEAVTSEGDSEMAQILESLIAAVNNVAAIATNLGEAIPARMTEIAMENGLAVPAA